MTTDNPKEKEFVCAVGKILVKGTVRVVQTFLTDYSVVAILNDNDMYSFTMIMSGHRQGGIEALYSCNGFFDSTAVLNNTSTPRVVSSRFVALMPTASALKAPDTFSYVLNKIVEFHKSERSNGPSS